MDVWTNLYNMIFSQTIEGLVVCVIITILLVIYLILALRISGYYKGILRRVRYLEVHIKEDDSLQNGFLVKVAKQYKNLLKSQTRELDFYALMEKSVPNNVKAFASVSSYFPSLAVVLGLLGTFIGLTGAIGSIRIGAGTGSEGTALIIESLAGPIDNMSTAFTTSIFGITASVLMTLYDRICRMGQLKSDSFLQTEHFFNATYYDYLTEQDPEILHRQIEDPAAKALTLAVDNFERSLDEFSGTINQFDQRMESMTGRAFSELTASVTALKDAYRQEQAGLRKVNDSLAGYMEVLSSLGDTVRMARENQANNTTLLEQIESSYRMLVQEHVGLESVVGTEALNELNNKLARIGEDIHAIAEAGRGDAR